MVKDDNRIQFRLQEPYLSQLQALARYHPEAENANGYARLIVEQVLADSAPGEQTQNALESGSGALDIEPLVSEIRELQGSIRDALLVVLGLVPLNEQVRERVQTTVREHFYIEDPD